MHRRTLAVAGVAAGALALAATARAEGDWSFDVNAGIGTLSGDATYEIGGQITEGGITEDGPFPISRLEWPLDVVMGQIAAKIGWRDTLELRGRYAFSLTDDAGTMKDSDWDYPAGGGRLLTVYSESDAILDATRWELDGRWWFWHASKGGADYAVGAGAGWIHQSYDWDARDGTQWYPADPELAADVWKGSAITYALDSDIPYLQLAGRVRSHRFTAEARVAYAPSIDVTDQDDHVDRNILAKTTADGDAWIAEIASEYAFDDHWYARVELQWLAYTVDGPSRNTVYGAGDGENQPGEQWTIYEEIKSSQSDANVALGYRF